MPLNLTPLEASLLTPVVARAVGPGVPGPAKMMAAKGLVPMGPRDLVTVLYQLSLDPDRTVADAAKATADGLPDNIAAAALGDALDPRVLHYFAAVVVNRAKLVEKVLLNRAVHDETFVMLASRVGEHELELMATNQERLLRTPAIIEAIYFNKQGRMSTVDRLLEMAVRNGLVLNEIPHYKDIAAAILGNVAGTSMSTTPGATGEEIDAAFREGLDDEGPVGDMELDQEQEDESRGNLRKAPLTVKLRKAVIGSAADRATLIRDSNRLVTLAVVRSKAVSDQEASRYAADKSLGEEVIREIAGRKDWQKNYKIKVALVNNPKCPLSHAMHLLPHLRANDVRALTRSKNVPSTLVTAAREMLKKKS